MTDLLNKFSEAAKVVSSSKTHMWECVYGAYVDHLSDIDTDDLPEEIQIFYESVKIRLTSVVPPDAISSEEALYLAKDILDMADVVRKYYKTSL